MRKDNLNFAFEKNWHLIKKLVWASRYLLFLSVYTKSSSCKLLICVLCLLSIMSTSHKSQVWLCRDPINQIHSIGFIQFDILWTNLARESSWSLRMAYATMPPGPNFPFPSAITWQCQSNRKLLFHENKSEKN